MRITHIPGLSAWFKPVQDITLGTRASRTLINTRWSIQTAAS